MRFMKGSACAFHRIPEPVPALPAELKSSRWLSLPDCVAT